MSRLGSGISETQLIGIRFLEWLHARQAEDPSGVHDPNAFAEAEDVWPHRLSEVIGGLEKGGLVRASGSLSGLPGVVLTPEGVRAVEATRERRGDTARRRRAARDALLRWLYDWHAEDRWNGLVTIQEFFADTGGHSLYEGEMFETADVDAAATYLHDKGLIEAVTVEEEGVVSARIRTPGVDCVEDHGGSVSDYVNRDRDARYQTNIYGPITGSQMAWGDHNQQTIENTGIDADALVILVKAITEALPVLGLEGDDRAGVASLAEQVQREATKERPDRRSIRSLLDGLGSILSNAGGKALAIVLQAAITHAAEALGLPSGNG